jgi:hypothetical protein
MSAADEINAKGWGSRALHECKRRPTQNHNLYQKVCMSPEERVAAVGRFSFEDVKKQIQSRIRYRTGSSNVQLSLPQEIFNDLDRNGDSLLTHAELERLERVVEDRWAPQRPKRMEIQRPTVSQPSRSTRNLVPSPADMLRLFDEDKDGVISPVEQLIADSYTRRKTEL